MSGVQVYDWQDDGWRTLDDPSGNVALMLTRAAASISQLESATVDAATWNGLTAQQRQDASRIAIRVVCRLARLVLGQLGSAA